MIADSVYLQGAETWHDANEENRRPRRKRISNADFSSLCLPSRRYHLEADKKGRRKTPDTTLLTLSTLVTKHPIQGRYLINLIVQGLLLQVYAMLLIFRARY